MAGLHTMQISTAVGRVTFKGYRTAVTVELGDLQQRTWEMIKALTWTSR